MQDVDLSVLIPLYEGAATVERTLRSLAVIGARARAEVLVVDDGSRDGGAELAERALAPLGFGTARVLRQANAGSAAARNRALRQARGRWVVFLDADDELLADPLALAEAAPPGTSALLGAAVIVRQGKVVRRYRPPQLEGARARRVFSTGNPLPISAFVVERARIEQPFDESLRYLEDWDFWLRNPALFARSRRVPEVLTRIHAHGGNKSGQHAALGRCRALIAEQRLAAGAALDSRERNNWRLQREIGRVLQNERPRWSEALAAPCDALLFAKFLAHALARGRVLARDPYTPGR